MKTKLLNFSILLFLVLVTVSSCSNEDFMDESINPTVTILQGGNDDAFWFSVVLVDPGAEKVKVIKVIREIIKCNLATAKYFVDNAPKELAVARKDTAEEFKKKLEEVGATVELK